MAIIDNPVVVGGGGGGTVDETSALKYMLEHKTNYAGIAAGLTNLTELPTFTQPSGITVYAYMFDSCTALVTSPTLTLPSTGSHDFRYMFRGCTGLTTFPNISLARASDITYMYSGCTNISGGISYQKTANYCSANNAFQNCTGITSFVITGTGGKFNSCATMFQRCSNITTITMPVGTATAQAQSVRFNSMCTSCSKLQSVTFNTSGDTELRCGGLSQAFQSCPKLVSVNCSININISECTTIQNAFRGCSLLTTIPTFTKTYNVTDFSYAFNNCAALVNLQQFDMSGATSATSLQNFVSGCTSLSNTSLNNILASLATWGGSSNKTLKYIGLTSAQATTCTNLSNWSALSAAGWTTGY